MIYVVEIPHRNAPTLWTAATREDFVARCQADLLQRSSSVVVHGKTTPRQLLTEHGIDSLDEARHSDPWIAELADVHGLDTQLYMECDGEWHSKPIDEYDAHRKQLELNLADLILLEGESAAKDALLSEVMWRRPGGIEARAALANALNKAAASEAA